MFHKILVAIDHSEFGQYVFDEALALAQATAANLILVNVLCSEDEASPSLPMLSGYEFHPGGLSRSVFEIYQELWQNYAAREWEMLQALSAQATAAGVEHQLRQGVGNPSSIICKLAAELQVDLIILGRRGCSGVNELLLGSVSNYVLHHAPCSVLTIHRPAQKATESARSQVSDKVTANIPENSPAMALENSPSTVRQQPTATVYAQPSTL